jgi:hypothetical protein
VREIFVRLERKNHCLQQNLLFPFVFGVQERLFESSSVKKRRRVQVKRNNCVTHLPSSCQIFNGRKISSTSSFFLQDFNRRKISSTSSFFLQDFNRRKISDQILPARSLRAANTKLVFSYSSFALQVLHQHARRQSVREQQKAGFPHYHGFVLSDVFEVFVYLLNKSLFMCSLQYCLELLLAEKSADVQYSYNPAKKKRLNV